MDFSPSEEDVLLRDALCNLIVDHYSFEQRERTRTQSAGFSREFWLQFADMGLLGLPFSEALGGLGGSPATTALVLEALGGALVLEPYFAGVVTVAGIFNQLPATEILRQHVQTIATGDAIVTLAHNEPHSRFDWEDVSTRATRTAEGWQLDGSKSEVLAGDGANFFIVSARTAGERFDRDGISLFLLDAKSAGIECRGYEGRDGRRAASLRFDAVAVPSMALLGDEHRAFTLLETLSATLNAALCAEAVGTMAAALDITVDYLKTRRQFGAAIGSFQAIQHRAVDMLIATELSRSMALYANLMLQDDDACARQNAVHAAKVQIADAARFIGEQAVQLHGGIGMTAEYRIGHYLKRLTTLAEEWGDSDYHLAELAAGGGLIGEWATA